MEDRRQALFAKTAQLLRNLNNERQIALREKTAAETKVAEAAKKDRAYALAKTAISRGIIDDDFESVENFIGDVMNSTKSLDVIEEATKMASGTQFSVEEASEEETGTGGNKVDALTSLIMGSAIE